ncbi:MAG: hypothetical protein LBT50_06860 [Prevotellaceae bacterium]|jgi:hypothetical protein|nr:hypothetical protein [Prevotellaceae bacterium]
MANSEISNGKKSFIEQGRKKFNRKKRKKFGDPSSHEKYDTRLVRGSVNLMERRFITEEDVDVMVNELLKLKLE